MSMASRIAAIDVGSNSMRVAVLDVGATGLLSVVEEERATRRLIRDVTRLGRLENETMDEALAIIADFLAIAAAAGADRTVAVATSAVRDASNSAEFVERAQRELGIILHVVEGPEEARLTFLGAVHSLPVEHGLVLDIGGGSLELAQFRDRALIETWTFPLGAVRLSDEVLMADPPKPSDVQKLHRYIVKMLSAAGVPQLGDDGVLVGTGGAIRNLSKVSAAATKYPLPRLHGHVLDRDELLAVRELLCAHDVESRAGISGLNSDRADSIIAGAIAVEATIKVVGAESLIVSGQGLREGIALAECPEIPSDLATIRTSSVRELQETFAPRWIENAERRAQLVHVLCGALLSDLAPDLLAALTAAAALMDAGRDIEYYRRGRQTESLLLAHGLPGYSHREIAATCALVRQAEQEKFNSDSYAPLLTEADAVAITQASAILAAAEDIARRSTSTAATTWNAHLDEGTLTLAGPLPSGSRPGRAAARLASAFDVALCIKAS
jgi:exopolyphosphatase / guanosine-5'-triphosphate,3'-diphosphate pyrophosphatase